MKQQKASKVTNLNLDEAHLIEQLRQHPTIMARVQSILKIAQNEEGPLKNADEVEGL